MFQPAVAKRQSEQAVTSGLWQDLCLRDRIIRIAQILSTNAGFSYLRGNSSQKTKISHNVQNNLIRDHWSHLLFRPRFRGFRQGYIAVK